MSSSDSEGKLDDSDEDQEIIDLTGKDLITSSPSNTASSSMSYSQSTVVSSTSNFSTAATLANYFGVGRPPHFYIPTDPVPGTSFSNTSASLPTSYVEPMSSKANLVDLTQEDVDRDFGESSADAGNRDSDRESPNLADVQSSDGNNRPSETSAKVDSKGGVVPKNKKLGKYLRKYKKKNLEGRKLKHGSLQTKKRKEKQGKQSDAEKIKNNDNVNRVANQKRWNHSIKNITYIRYTLLRK